MSAEVYKQDQQWVHRIKSFFNLLDYNKNGYIHQGDWERLADNIEKAFKPDPPNLMDRVRETADAYFTAIGIKGERKLTCDEFIEAFSEFAVKERAKKERAKKERGEEPLLYPMNDAVYDVADTTKDGFVTIEEYRRIFKAGNLPESGADVAFKVAGANSDGKIDRQKLNDYEFEFWFATGAHEAKGMFGEAFEIK